MARRRMISQDIISDEHFNSISLEAQNIFLRMLTVSDDCGVVPANIYKLNVLINTPQKLIKKIQLLIDEIVEVGLGIRFKHKDEDYFAFKPSSFEDYQSYILKKATKSEYLRIPKDEFMSISKNFQELPRISSRHNKSAVSTVESIEYKVESKKQKEEEIEIPKKLLSFVRFKEAWDEWIVFRKEIKKPLVPSTIKEQLEFLSKQSNPVAVIKKSIQSQWQGLFELKSGPNIGDYSSKDKRLEECQYCHKKFPNASSHELSCNKAPPPASPEAVKRIMDEVNNLSEKMKIK